MFTKIKSVLRFLYLLRVEPFMLLIAFCFAIKKTPLEVLIQDKLCRNKYNLTEEFCMHLPHMEKHEPNYDQKTLILSDAVQYNMYHTLITVTPGITWSLFLGPWTDKYIYGRKAIFIIGSITQCMETSMNLLNSYYFTSNINWILLSFIPYTLSGSMVWTTAYSYVAATTPPHLRSLRMTLFDICLVIASLIGTFSSGYIVNMSPVGRNGQLHNCALIFFISSLGLVGAFVWAVFVIDQQNDKKLFDKYFVKKNISEEKEVSHSDEKKDENSDIHPIKLLFNIKNVKQIVMTCTKKRSKYARAQIWLIFFGMFCNTLLASGPQNFLFQFTEKIYNWDAKLYTSITAFGAIANSSFLLIIAPILIRILKLNDMNITMIGYTGIFINCLSMANILSPTGYFIGASMACPSSLASIGSRSHLSKIVDISELGQVFTLMAILDGFAPILASSLFAKLFGLTIDSRVPGTCYLILSFLAVTALVISMIIDLLHRHVNKNNTENKSEKCNKSEKSNSNEKSQNFKIITKL